MCTAVLNNCRECPNLDTDGNDEGPCCLHPPIIMQQPKNQYNPTVLMAASMDSGAGVSYPLR